MAAEQPPEHPDEPDDPAETADPDGGDAPQEDPQLAAAVEDAVRPEVDRMRAAFIRAIVGLDRGEGVGRGEPDWDVGELDEDRDEPDGPTP